MEANYWDQQAEKLIAAVGIDAIRVASKEGGIQMLPRSAFDGLADDNTRAGIFATAVALIDGRRVPGAIASFWGGEARRLADTVGLNYLRTATPEQIAQLAGDAYASAGSSFIEMLTKVAVQQSGR